jgi:tetratricopeptide (TPR) repeat protein
LARILWESESPDDATVEKVDEHRQRAEQLLPKTAEAYFLRAMTALTIKDKLDLLDDALRLDPSHYESRRLRAYIYQASRKYEEFERDALVMIALPPRKSLDYSLHAIACHQLGQYEEAIEDYNSAINLTAVEDPQYVDLNARRCDTLMAMRQYDRVIADARQCLEFVKDAIPLEFRIFCALIALGDYEQANSLFQRVIDSDHFALHKLRDWCRKYVFDTLQAGRAWHPPGSEPKGFAFQAMLEADETYHRLSAKARRVVTDAFTAHWSPDGAKLAFSTGFVGHSGVAVWDVETGETDLLIVPGKDPQWSPDGRHIVFVRDCQALPVSGLASAERENRPPTRGGKGVWIMKEEVWIMKADGMEARRLVSGRWPRWRHDPNHIYLYSQSDRMLCQMSIEHADSRPQPILTCDDRLPEISPDEKYVACIEGTSLKILELASGSLSTEWTFPSELRGTTWASDGCELCFGAERFAEISSGLWVYDLDKKQTRKVLEGPVQPRSLALDGTKLVLNLPSPYFEIWVADLDPNAGIVESLGPGLTLDEHCQEQLAFYTQRIKANPEDANNYSRRAQYHGYLGDRASASADMRRWTPLGVRL